MQNQQAIIRQIFGKRGSGKTVKARNLTKDQNRVLYYDTLGRDYDDGVLCESLAELKDYWLKVYQQSYNCSTIEAS